MHQNYTTEQLNLPSAFPAATGQEGGSPVCCWIAAIAISESSSFCHSLPASRWARLRRRLVRKGRPPLCGFLPVDLSTMPEANVWTLRQHGLRLPAASGATGHRQLFHLPVVGITGSKWQKRSLKGMALSAAPPGLSYRSQPQSFNSQVGVPFRLAIAAGSPTGHLRSRHLPYGEMEKLAPIIRCNIGLFTNTYYTIQTFPSIETKIDQKLRLFDYADIILYRRDDERVPYHRGAGKPSSAGRGRAKPLCILIPW